MTVLRNYIDTKNELEIAQYRLNYLLDKKENLYLRYCSVATSKIDITKVQNSKVNQDNMAEYLHELTKKQPNGLSLDDEIINQQNIVDKLKYYITLMNDNLKQMKGVEYKLYYAIVVEAKGITKGITEVSENTGKSERTLWKNYYPKIEQEIKELEVNK
jgi:predicted  nucleic acid-binding Zn-ribbon protein